ncbi:TetR/AcrR family transcriptional regulator [Gordonia hankookensis]|uniref:TetR family transcriptional regulator n=1 Tax=Gordonia hankookensis TaxID=589403 RepID=A0ABR7W995_9ACTN|nr:TetR family transcriptional regulator [Gordonia hankookensis]MBD1319338.1 TetR family transcriptional regulator [Gordonia hankookensis]NDZ97426.1 TetR family transcriptional regulator [Streptomyces sp. SID11726]NEB27103.1 TetR family transcriptional regulator [Streptomyces sp. SID6673]
MARPLIPVDDILDRALALLDDEGVDALSARRLAGDLRISTRTLYQQVGNREALIRALVARHFANLRLEFRDTGEWESTAVSWCLTLRETLRAHPYLTELMSFDDRRVITDFVGDLVKVARNAGIPASLAAECCRALVNVTVNHTIVEVRALHDPALSAENAAEAESMARNLPLTIRWILSGVHNDVGPSKHTVKQPWRDRRIIGKD